LNRLLFRARSVSNFVFVLLFAVSATQASHAQNSGRRLLISVAFKTDNPYGNSPAMSGPDAAANVANPLFAAANVWNNLQANYGVLNTNPSWSDLVDHDGKPTGVNFSINGTVVATDFWPWVSNPDQLRSPFILWNSFTNGGGAAGPGESTRITWTLTGLPPDTTFDMCLYGSYADVDRGFDMTIQGVTMQIPTFNNANTAQPNCVLFPHVTSDARGTIRGVGAGVGDSTTAANEADWSGFQLVEGGHRAGLKSGFFRAITH